MPAPSTLRSRLWGFVDDETFLTKAGHVGLVYRIQGQDAEGLTHDQRRQLVHQMEAALRLLDERCRVYQYVLRQEAEPFVAVPCTRPVAHEAIARRTDYLNARRERLFTLDHFLVLLYEPASSVRTTSAARACATAQGSAPRLAVARPPVPARGGRSRSRD